MDHADKFPALTPSSSRVVRLLRLTRMIELNLLKHAEAGAFLEVERIFLEQHSLPLLQRWLKELDARHEQFEHAKARRSDDSPVVQEVSEDQYRKLKSASAAMDHAFNECSAAFAEKDCSRLNRWINEYKLCLRHYTQLAGEWLKAYQEKR